MKKIINSLLSMAAVLTIMAVPASAQQVTQAAKDSVRKYFPGNYFVVGTGTAEGTYSSTTDRFIVNTSRFKIRTLFRAVPDSWESLLRSGSNTICYIDTRDKQYTLPALPLRFTGYGTSDKNDFVMSRLNQLFDGYIFIPVTQATAMQQ